MSKSVIDVLGYDTEFTRIMGCDIERFYIDSTHNDKLVASRILYHGSSPEDARENLMSYWERPMRWYFCGTELRHT